MDSDDEWKAIGREALRMRQIYIHTVAFLFLPAGVLQRRRAVAASSVSVEPSEGSP